MTKSKEKVELCNAFIASVFKRPTVLQIPSPLSWKTETRTKMKFPYSQGKYSVTCDTA